MEKNLYIDASHPNETRVVLKSNGNIEDGLWHNTKFSWDPSTNLFEVSFDGSIVISQVIDITNNVFSGNPIVYWGFTSSTGGASNMHKFRFNDATFYNVLSDQTICLGEEIRSMGKQVSKRLEW